MSLISRVEVTNYLTEGINPNRRSADWKPMLTGITLRTDGGKSALVNITNGGGKTSLVELLLYLLSRDARLLKKIREKVAPKNRGYTHARIEFRTLPEDTYSAPSLLEIDPLNLSGETHVVGVALHDDINEQPIFYSYSGTLEDSPCYLYDRQSIAQVPDNAFVAATRALRGCKWNRFANRLEWEDHIRLFLPVEVIRRNVVYQLKGSDDQNASFFDFKPRGGESHDSAFFRAVVAPDLLSNLLSSFAEEDESAVEDTLLKSLTQIVRADKEIAAKNKRLVVREEGIAKLEPILAAGRKARQLQQECDGLLRKLRSDVAFLRYFGVQGSRYALPGLPRSLPRLGEQDPRILTALKGMVILPDEGIVLLDKALSDLSGVEVRVISQVADRKQIMSFSAKSQVIDFACDFETLNSGSVKGGHYRKGYTKEAAVKLPDLLANISGAKTTGLKEVLLHAFIIAEGQIDTNPGSRQVRALEGKKHGLLESAQSWEASQAQLASDVNKLRLQVKDRAENQGAWDDFVGLGALLPEDLRTEPMLAKTWLSEQFDDLQAKAAQRNIRRGELNQVWREYTGVLDHHGLEGLQGAQDRLVWLQTLYDTIQAESRRILPAIREASKVASALQRAIQPLADKRDEASRMVETFNRLAPGVQRFVTVFGTVEPSEVDPAGALSKAVKAHAVAQFTLRGLTEEQDNLRRLKAHSATFEEIFGAGTDSLTYDPITRHAQTLEELSSVRQDLAALLPQKEAIETFNDRFPQTTPHSWLKEAVSTRSRLREELQAHRGLEKSLSKESEAIEQMRSVEDGSFEAAWAILAGSPIRAVRLHQALLSAGMPSSERLDAMSALSGILSAPVFESIEDLNAAAQLLEGAAAWVPLILKDELSSALSRGVASNGQVRMLGFIGGVTSRRVRILLEPEFARAELDRLARELLSCQSAIARIELGLTEVAPEGDAYQLALKAKAALDARAGERCEEREKDAELLEKLLGQLKIQIAPQARAVLDAAKEFKKLNGLARLSDLDSLIPQREEEVRKTSEEKAAAEERASHENLTARDDALEHCKLGGEAAFAAARTAYENACEAVEIAEAKAEEAQEVLAGLDAQQQELNRKQQAYAEDGGEQVRALYQRVLYFAKSSEDVQFMRDFAAASEEVSGTLAKIAAALAVKFERAEAFRAHQGKSDMALLEEIARKEQDADQLKSKAEDARAKAERIARAEVPNWQRLSKVIHDMAFEVGSRVARSKAAATQAANLEEGAAVPEAHAGYKQAMAVFETLSDPALESYGAVIESVEALAQTVQAMDLHEALQQHKAVASEMTAAAERYRDQNAMFCSAALEAVQSRDSAFNALEVEEIGRATPDTIEALGVLFTQLQASLSKERDEAKQAMTIATQTAEDTLTQLAGLIQSATDNLATLNKVMARYPQGRFFFETQITGKAGVQDILNELKLDVERALRDQDGQSRGMRRGSDTQLKTMLRERLIECVFTNSEVQFVNGGIHGGRKGHVSGTLSTGQKIALEFMWIVRQAEYEIERGLHEMTSKQAARSRAKANRVILIDGIFSTLSDRRIIKEALNGLRDLGGNFQIIGFLHSPNWNNDFAVFPVYHVGKKLVNREGDGLVSFRELGREPGTVGFVSAITQPLLPEGAS